MMSFLILTFTFKLFLTSFYLSEGEFLIDTSYLYSTQKNVDLAKGDNRILCVFEDSRNLNRAIYGVWLDQFGNPVDAIAFQISDTNSTNPRVAYGDGVFLVIWKKGESYGNLIKGRIVTPDSMGTIVTLISDSLYDYYGYIDKLDVVYTPPLFAVFSSTKHIDYHLYLLRVDEELEPITPSLYELYEFYGGFNGSKGDFFARSDGDIVCVSLRVTKYEAAMHVYDHIVKITVEVKADSVRIIESKTLESLLWDPPPAPEMWFWTASSMTFNNRGVPIFIWERKDSTCATRFRGFYGDCVPYILQHPIGALNYDGKYLFLLVHNFDNLLYGIPVGSGDFFKISDSPLYPPDDVFEPYGAYAFPVGEAKQLIIWSTMYEFDGGSAIRLVGKHIDVLGQEEKSHFAKLEPSVRIIPQIGKGGFRIYLSPLIKAQSIEVLRSSGQLVYRFSAGEIAERGFVYWDGRDILGNFLPSGVYIVVISGKYFFSKKKIIIVR